MKPWSELKVILAAAPAAVVLWVVPSDQQAQEAVCQAPV
jgi:hypothetical protein